MCWDGAKRWTLHLDPGTAGGSTPSLAGFQGGKQGRDSRRGSQKACTARRPDSNRECATRRFVVCLHLRWSNSPGPTFEAGLPSGAAPVGRCRANSHKKEAVKHWCETLAHQHNTHPAPLCQQHAAEPQLPQRAGQRAQQPWTAAEHGGAGEVQQCQAGELLEEQELHIARALRPGKNSHAVLAVGIWGADTCSGWRGVCSSIWAEKGEGTFIFLLKRCMYQNMAVWGQTRGEQGRDCWGEPAPTCTHQGRAAVRRQATADRIRRAAAGHPGAVVPLYRPRTLCDSPFRLYHMATLFKLCTRSPPVPTSSRQQSRSASWRRPRSVLSARSSSGEQAPMPEKST